VRRRELGSIDNRTPLLLFAGVTLFGWYQAWYVQAGKLGWPAGWPVSKLLTLLVPFGLLAYALFFADTGEGMATRAARLEAEAKAREENEKSPPPDA